VAAPWPARRRSASQRPFGPTAELLEVRQVYLGNGGWGRPLRQGPLFASSRPRCRVTGTGSPTRRHSRTKLIVPDEVATLRVPVSACVRGNAEHGWWWKTKLADVGHPFRRNAGRERRSTSPPPAPGTPGDGRFAFAGGPRGRVLGPGGGPPRPAGPASPFVGPGGRLDPPTACSFGVAVGRGGHFRQIAGGQGVGRAPCRGRVLQSAMYCVKTVFPFSAGGSV